MNRHPIIIKGRQSCRRGDGIQSNHTRAGPIIRWAGSRNGHYPALLSSIARISPIFPAIPSFLCSSFGSSRASIFPASLAHHLGGKPIDNRYIADFPCHSLNRSLVIANRHLPRIPHTSEASPSTGATSPIFIGSRHDRLIHCLAPSRPMAPSSPARPWPQAGHLKLLIVLKIVHSAQVLGKRAEKPFFRGVAG